MQYNQGIQLFHMTFSQQTLIKTDIKFEQQFKTFSPILDQGLQEQLSQSGQLNQGKWTEQENLKFVIFISQNKDIFKSKEKRKAEKIFKNLSAFVQSRNSRQCRSHFQKAMKKFSTVAKMKNYYRCEVGEMEFDQKMTEDREKILVINQDLKCRETKTLKLVNTQVQTEPLLMYSSIIYEQFRTLPYPQHVYWYFPSF